MSGHPEKSRADIVALLPDNYQAALIFARWKPSVTEIINAVCGHYRINPANLTKGVDRVTSLCRTLVCHFSREINRSPNRELGIIIARHENHVGSLLNKFDGRMTADELLRDDVDIIRRRIAQAAMLRGALRVSQCR